MSKAPSVARDAHAERWSSENTSGSTTTGASPAARLIALISLVARYSLNRSSSRATSAKAASIAAHAVGASKATTRIWKEVPMSGRSARK
jgi:hypothetical protein